MVEVVHVGQPSTHSTGTARLQYFADGSGRVSASGNLLSGVLAGGVEAVLWTAPTERLKVLQQKKVSITKHAIFTMCTGWPAAWSGRKCCHIQHGAGPH